MNILREPDEFREPPFRLWEAAVVLSAMLLSLAFGFPNLAGPCLWHDELVQVYVAKHIAAHGWPALPSGVFYPSSMAYNYLLAGVVALFGDGPVAVRSPSVVLGALNVLLTYLLVRRLAGREVAVVAALALAVSPWQVAWARQARFYPLQMTAYLLFLQGTWAAFEAKTPASAVKNAALALGAYTLGMFTSFHSALFLGTAGGYALAMGVLERRWRSRWTVAILLCGVTGVITLAALWFNPNPADRQAVFETGLGGTLIDAQRPGRFFYLQWLNNNLSTGFLLLALLGTAGLALRERRRGVFLVLAFWAPVLALTFLIGYRRERFMFFAFPLYCALFSYALVALVPWMARFRQSWRHGLAALAIFLFFCRLAVSEAHLVQDSLDTARGAPLTLAKKHPQWDKPSAYLRAHRTDEAVLTTTYLNALYYVGHADNWFPNRYQWWEGQESGLKGLGSLDELEAFVREHPRGFFIAEYERFEKWKDHTQLKVLAREFAWIREHMRRIDEACSEDVALYAWPAEGNSSGTTHGES